MGRTLIGFLADRVGPVNAMWTVIMLSGLTQLLVWTFVSTYAGIVRTFPQLVPRTPLSPVACNDSWRSRSYTASSAVASSRSRPPSPRSSGAPAGSPASPGSCCSLTFPVRRNILFTLSSAHVLWYVGNSAGAPLGGAILSGTGGNWTAVSCYSGGLQIIGATVLLYGASAIPRGRNAGKLI